MNTSNFPLVKLFPSFITVTALCAGLTALKYSMYAKWNICIGFIVLAAILDALDGKLARALNASTKFGTEIDSLSDFFNFGIAPAMITYLWNGHLIKGFGWAAALFWAICAIIRLARFNIASLDEGESRIEKELEKRFFYGIPTPAAAVLCLLPIFITFEYPALLDLYNPKCLIAYQFAISFMMIVRVPTFSIKKIAVPKSYVKFILALFGFFIVMLAFFPWATLMWVSIFYVCSIPLTAARYKIVRKNLERKYGKV